MDPDARDALLRGVLHHRLQVVDMGVDIAVAEEADEMQGRIVLLDIVGDFAPSLAGEHLLRGNGVGDELRTLVEDTARAHRVVSDLGVAHVSIAGQANGNPVGLQLRVGAIRQKPVEMGSVGGFDRVAVGILAIADTIHDDEKDRATTTLEPGRLVESVNHF